MKRFLASLSAGLLVLAGCTDVPGSSSPDVIEPLDTGAASSTSLVAPGLDRDARDIVTLFLAANATDSGTHPVARQYLTGAASKGWLDDTATIIADDYTTSLYNTRSHTVTVFGRVLGTLSVAGVYTPSLQGVGAGGTERPFVFHIAKVGKQFRIAKLASGLLLSEAQFRAVYRQAPLYFFDLSGQTLVPDLRWSSLEDRAQLADWMLAQLVDGPRPELQNAVSLDTLPQGVQITVLLGTPTQVEIPGSNQLDPNVRRRLAAQLSLTLLEPLAGREMTITDHGTPVQIPSVGEQFSAADFPSVVEPVAPTAEVYYLAGGRLRDGDGHAVSGAAAGGGVPLTSVAIGQPQSGDPLLVAGVSGPADDGKLEVGTLRSGLRATSLRGQLSRPAFAPGRAEVWIGAGSKLYRINVDGSAPHPVQVPILSGGGRIVAVRFSPDGSRLAVVITGANGLKQLYIGTVVRGVGPPRVDSLKPISPEGVAVTDVAWLDSFKLFAIGYLAGSLDSRTFETGVDGTDWTNTPANLPGAPNTVTAATSASVWVSASGYVWKLSGTSWISPGPTGQTRGTAPVYLE